MDVAEIGITAEYVGVEKATDALDDLEKQTRKTAKSTDKLNKEQADSAKIMDGVALTAGKVVAGLISVSAVISAMQAGIRTIREWSTAVSGMAAHSRATADELEAMKTVARDLGKTTMFSAAEAAGGMATLSEAGLDASESMQAIPHTLNLARVGAMNLSTAAGEVSSLLRAWGIEADKTGKLVDLLTASTTGSNLTIEEMTTALADIGPIAQSFGIGIETIAAAMNIMSDAGLTGSEAASGLTSVLDTLSDPSKKVVEFLESMGLKMEDLNPRTNDLAAIMGTLSEAGFSGADALKAFGEEGADAVIALSSRNSDLNATAQGLTDVGGAAQEMVDVLDNNPDAQIAKLSGALDDLAISLGEAGAIQGLMNFINWVTTAVLVVGKLTDDLLYLFGVINKNDGARIQQRMKEIEFLMQGFADPNNAQLEPLRAEYEELDAQLQRLGLTLTDNRSRQELAAAWHERMRKQAEGNTKAIKQQTDAQKDGTDASNEDAKAKEAQAKAYANLAQSASDIMDKYDPLRAAQREVIGEYHTMRDALDQLIITSQEYSEWEARNLHEIVVTAQRRNVEMEIAAEQTKAQAEALAVSFNRGIERMRDGVGDFFEDFLLTGDITFDKVLDLFKQMIAEMLATAAANKIFISAGLIGAGGAGVAGEALSSGLGSGGIVDLFSSGGAIHNLWSAGFAGLGQSLSKGLTSIGLGNVSAGFTDLGSLIGPNLSSGTQTLIGGAATLGAGLLGNYAGQAVFQNEESTGIGSTAGGLVGTYLGGALGAGIGAFVGEGIEAGLRKVFGWKEGGNNAGGGAFDLGAGTSDLSLLGNNGGANLESAKEMVAVLQDFATAIGGSDFKGNLQVGSKEGIKFNGQKYSDITSFLQDAFDDIIEGATGLSEVSKDILRNFDGTVDELATFAMALGSIDEMLGANPVQKAFDDFKVLQDEASMSVMDAYNRQIHVIRGLVNEYDGSVSATVELNNAMKQNQNAAYQMTLQIQQLRLEMQSMIGNSAKAIRDSVLSEDQLFEQAREERNQLQRDLRTIDDANELAQALARLEELNRQMFETIEDPTENQAEKYARFAEKSLELAETRLEQIERILIDTQKDQIDRVGAVLQDVAARQSDSTDRFAAAVTTLANAVDQLGELQSNNVTI